MRQPVDRVADDLGVGECSATTARIRSTSAAARACSVARVGLGLLPCLGGGQSQGDHRLGVGAPALELAGPGRAGATGVRSGTTSTPTPAGPPHQRASPASTSYAVGGASRPARARRPPAAVRRGLEARCHASASGCRVPTSPLAAWTAAATVPGAARALVERLEVDPPEPVHRDLLETVGVAGRGRVVAAEGEDAGVLDGRGDQPGAPAAPGVQQPLAPRSQRDRARGQERQLGRPHAQPGCDHLAGPVQQRASLPPLGVEAARVGPPGVERGQQRVAGGGQQRSRRGVQQRAGRRTPSGVGDTP